MHSYPFRWGVSVFGISSGFGSKKSLQNAVRPIRGIRKLYAILLLAGCTGFSQAAVLVHEFYLPMPEAQIRQAYGLIETNLSNTLDSAFSVVVTGDGTVVYYDQWEDGYETDMSHPTQSTTQIWGDGNNANGIAPGFTNDPVGLPAGTVLTLRNLVPLPRNPSTLLFDARDRIAATKALVVSRFAWPTTPGRCAHWSPLVPGWRWYPVRRSTASPSVAPS